MSTRLRSGAWLAVAAFGLSIVYCQEPAQPAAAAAPESSVTYRTGAHEVSLDLVVRDAKGKIVKNVSQQDLEVLEDGVKQNLVDFRFVAGRDDSPAAAANSADHSTEAIASETTAARHPINEVNVVCLVFHSLDPQTRRNAVQFARQFIQNNLPPNTWVGVFSLGDSLTAMHEFTNDKAEMLAAINATPTSGPQDFLSMASRILSASPNIATINVSISGSGASTTATSSLVITGGEVSLQAINGADVSTSEGANRVRGDQADARREFTGVAAHRNFDSMNLLIDRLSTLPGHKSVLFLSTGLVGLSDPDRMDKMIKKANQGGITFYAVDVTGLEQNSNTLAATNALAYAASVSQTQQANTSAAMTMEKMRQGDYIDQGVRQSNTQSVMRQISEDTGGFLIANSNDLRKPFGHLIQDIETHYEAVYRPQNPVMDGSLRTIEVKLNHPGWTVESRTGYYALPAMSGQNALDQADLLGLAALNITPAPHAFHFDTEALQFRPEDNGLQRAIAFEMPVRELSVTTLNGGANYRVHASVLLLIKDANGNVIDKYSQDSPFEFPKSSLKQAAFSSLNFAHPVNLPAGKYTAEIAVVDQESKRASVSHFDFVNAEPKALSVSSVTLVQQFQPVGKDDPGDPFIISNGAAHRRAIPQIRPLLTKDAKPMAFFVVYPDKHSKDRPRVQVELLLDGKPLAKQVAELGAARPDGGIPMFMQAPMGSGALELKVTALQGSETATQTLQYSVNP